MSFSFVFARFSWSQFRSGPGLGLVLMACIAVGTPAAAQTQLQRNPLPKGYRGPLPGGAPARANALIRVRLRVVDAEGQPLYKALVRVEGSPQQLLSDENGTFSLLADLDHGPLRLRCSCFGYDDGQLSIERPEDNNLVFQLFRSKDPSLIQPPR